jgi:DNA helicase-2/ATP-dependent DNA helicase PcrA
VRVEDSDNPLKAAADAEVGSAFPGAARGSYGRFVHVLRGLGELGGPSDMIDELMREFYDDVLTTKFDNAALRREDIRGLSSFSGQYHTVEALMADVALAGDFSGETVVTGPDDDEYVTLSTIHQAKGLEWDVVLIPWLADGYFPTDFALNSQEDEEEERRVFHVAVTRAKDEVYFAYPQVRRGRSENMVLMKPSRFLTELAEGLTETMELEDGLPELIAGEDNVLGDQGARAVSGPGLPLPKPDEE